MDDSNIFFIKLPTGQQFCHAVLKIIDKPTKWPQAQTLKCRQLLFLCRDVIAGPNFYDDSLLDVVMSMVFFKDKKIRPFCQKLGLQPVHASPALSSVFQECFTYTLRFRISSSWNLISNFLVKGPDVVTCAEKQEAVDLDIIVSDEQITLAIRPFAIRNPPPSLDEFNICYQALQNFREDPDGTIEQFSIYGSWCHIMPSMKRGQLVKVTRKIPNMKQQGETTPSFTDYNGLKKYWKNHHGIRLPESEEGMLYGSIYFKLIGQPLFTYPLCCLRTREIQIMPRCDGSAIINNFMACLQQRMPQLCGMKLTYSSKPCYATTNLSGATQIKTGKIQNISMESGNRKIPPPPPPPRPVEIPQLSQNSRKDVILPSQVESNKAQDNKENYPSSQIIPSSQVEQKKGNGIIRKVMKGLPMTADGKYIPVFTSRKSNVTLKSTSNCAKKIELDLTKKKKPTFTKRSVANGNTPKQPGRGGKINSGIVTSAAAGKKYKTPAQTESILNDSGYGSSETPIPADRIESKAAKKYRPKKLSFDHILNSVTKESNNSTKRALNKQRSPLKIIKNHAFGTLFSKAADIPEKAAAKNLFPGTSKSNSPLKVIKNNSFDKLFSTAGTSGLNEREISSVTPFLHEQDSGIRIPSHLPLKVIKNHAFDSLFTPAKNFETVDFSRQSADENRNSFSKHLSTISREAMDEVKGHKTPQNNRIIPGNHSFDNLFATASNFENVASPQPSVPLFGTSVVEARPFMPQFTKKNHSFEELLKSARAESMEGQTLQSICNAGNAASGVVVSHVASIDRQPSQTSAVWQSGERLPPKTVQKRLGTGSSPRQPKKPRNTQSVEELAKSDMLKKANAPTLLSWLRLSGVSVSSRDKKDDLVAKVKLQIMLKGGDFRGIDD